MAIAFGNAADLGNNGGSSGSYTASYTLGTSSNLLWVSVVGDTSSDLVTGVTYAGVSMTLAAKQGPVSSSRWTYLFYLESPTGGTNNVVVTASSPCYLICGAVDYSGAATSGQPDATATNDAAAGTASSLTTSLTTVASSCWTVLAGYCKSGAPAAGSGSTRRADDGSFSLWGLFDSNGGVTGSTSMTFTTTGGDSPDDMLGVMASFAPAGGGGTPGTAFVYPAMSCSVSLQMTSFGAASGLGSVGGAYLLGVQTKASGAGAAKAAAGGIHGLAAQAAGSGAGTSTLAVGAGSGEAVRAASTGAASAGVGVGSAVASNVQASGSGAGTCTVTVGAGSGQGVQMLASGAAVAVAAITPGAAYAQGVQATTSGAANAGTGAAGILGCGVQMAGTGGGTAKTLAGGGSAGGVQAAASGAASATLAAGATVGIAVQAHGSGSAVATVSAGQSTAAGVQALATGSAIAGTAYAYPPALYAWSVQAFASAPFVPTRIIVLPASDGTSLTLPASDHTHPTLPASLTMCAYSNAQCFQGEDLLLTFQLNPVVDITGESFEFVWAYSRGGPVCFAPITATLPNPTLGQVQVAVASALIAQLPPGRYISQLRRTTPGAQAVLAEVTWNLGPAVVPVGG